MTDKISPEKSESPKATIREFSVGDLAVYPAHGVGRIEAIESRVAETAADGRLVPDTDGEVYLVNLTEKLLVPLLCKLGNLVPEGGIWLTTQRPEWNDANNALVGHGVSMVTLYYLRRYVRFLQDLLGEESGAVELSEPVARWLADTTAALEGVRPLLGDQPVTAIDLETADG